MSPMKDRRQLLKHEWLMREASSQIPHVLKQRSLSFAEVGFDMEVLNVARLLLGAPKALREMIFSARNLG